MNTRRIISLFLLVGAIRVTAVTFTGSYSQNFNTLTDSGSPNWANDSTLPGWYLFRQNGANSPVAITSYGLSSGSDTAGSFYSFGSVGSNERALGGVGTGTAYFGSPSSGAVAGWIAAAFVNGSGNTLSAFTVNWDGEQWRNSGDAFAQTMVFEYGFGSSFETVASWIAPGGTFNWSSPAFGSPAGSVDGNALEHVAARGGTINAAWAANQTLWLRWVERNDVRNDHGLAIDDFSLAAQGVQTVPESLPRGVEIGVLLGLLAVARRLAVRAA